MDVTSINEFQILLKEFDKIPKPDYSPTYMELCKYPSSRFEEICSRLLCFYLDPSAEHQLHDLFVKSLVSLTFKDEINYDEDDINVITEDYAERKRIDIVVSCPDFTIGIENKIFAALYNPLEIYRKRISNYNSKRKSGVVLSINKIENSDLKKFINSNCFVNITYAEFFSKIRENIGLFIQNGHKDYITYLLDFFKTIENMDPNTKFDKATTKFFFENKNQIGKLISQFNSFEKYMIDAQNSKLKEILSELSKETKVKWEIYKGWDLIFSETISNTGSLGIEANFEDSIYDPIGAFIIYISTWSVSNMQEMQDLLYDKFFNLENVSHESDRIKLKFAELNNPDLETILKVLKQAHDQIMEVIRHSNRSLPSEIN
jgi:hypothetical protein